MSVPILLALSDMSRIAISATSAALSVSPFSDFISAAEKLVTVSMYSFADIPEVMKALCAYSWTFIDESLKRVSTPPTSCS